MEFPAFNFGNSPQNQKRLNNPNSFLFWGLGPTKSFKNPLENLITFNSRGKKGNWKLGIILNSQNGQLKGIFLTNPKNSSSQREELFGN